MASTDKNCNDLMFLCSSPLLSTLQCEMAALKTLLWIKYRANSIMLSMWLSQKSIYFMRTHAGFNVSIPALPSHVPLWAARGRSFNSPERVWERMDPQRTSNCAKKLIYTTCEEISNGIYSLTPTLPLPLSLQLSFHFQSALLAWSFCI